MAEPDLARLGHLNLIEFAREGTRWSDDGVLHEEGGVACCASGSPFPVLTNIAYRVDDRVPAARVIEQAREFFHDLGRGFSLQLHDEHEIDLMDAAEAAGLDRMLDAPEMLCPAPVPAKDPPLGVELRSVTDDGGVADFVAVNAEAYTTLGMPANVITEAITRPDRLLTDYLESVVAYVDGEPMAAAQTLVSHGIAGVYFVGTREQGRGRGLGELVTTWVTNAGFAMGARANSLQASHMGEPIYRRMGYEEVYRYVTYVDWGPGATSLAR